MAANVLTYNAIGTILNQIVTQATGKAVITPTNTSEFVTVAQTGLLAGYDNLMGSISQVLSKTIMSTRPYYRKFQGLEADSIRYGNHVRKINYIDRSWQDGSRLPLTTGVPVDDQAPTLDDVLQKTFILRTIMKYHGHSFLIRLMLLCPAQMSWELLSQVSSRISLI